jgi:hypothetical protein
VRLSFETFAGDAARALSRLEELQETLSQRDLPRDLEWQVVERAMEESCGAEGKEQVYKALNGQLYNMDLDLQREAQRLITLLTDKVAGRTRARSVCSGARTPVCVGKCLCAGV